MCWKSLEDLEAFSFILIKSKYSSSETIINHCSRVGLYLICKEFFFQTVENWFKKHFFYIYISTVNTLLTLFFKGRKIQKQLSPLLFKWPFVLSTFGISSAGRLFIRPSHDRSSLWMSSSHFLLFWTWFPSIVWQPSKSCPSYFN